MGDSKKKYEEIQQDNYEHSEHYWDVDRNKAPKDIGVKVTKAVEAFENEYPELSKEFKRLKKGVKISLEKVVLLT